MRLIFVSFGLIYISLIGIGKYHNIDNGKLNNIPRASQQSKAMMLIQYSNYCMNNITNFEAYFEPWIIIYIRMTSQQHVNGITYK